MKTKKLFSWLLTAAMLLTGAAVPASAEGETEVQTVYKASDAWSTEKSGNDFWTWEYSDKTTNYAYNSLNGQIATQTGFGTSLTANTEGEITTGDAWKNNAAWNYPGIGQNWMIPYIKTSDTTSQERARFSVSRTFKAPMSGTVTLSTEDGNIYGNAKQSGVDNTTAYIRITRNGQQIWPKSGEIQIPYDKAIIQTYNFEPVTAVIYKGDVLRFEVYNGNGDGGYGKRTYWAPVVTYTSAQANADMVYNSRDAWPDELTNTTTISNDNPVWQFIYRNDQSNNQFKAYTLTAGNNTHNYVAPKANEDGSYDYSYQAASGNYTRLFCDSQDNAYMRNAIGKYWMRLSVATGSSPKQNADNRIVKSFTAPRSGNVCISASDMSGDSKIYNRFLTATNTKGAVVNILKWTPDGKDELIWTHTFAYNADTTPAKNGVESIDFENMSVYMNKGEQLWFMVSGATGGSAYAKQVFWNPVVSYYDTAQTPAERIYKATDAWSTDADNKYNGHTEWKWEQYDASAASPQFSELNYYQAAKARFGQDPADTSTEKATAPSWDQSSNSNLAGVGQYWMTPRADSKNTAAIIKNHSVSRTFTAPFTGTVTLSAEDTDSKGIIHAYGGSPKPAENAPAYLRITKNGTQIWPKYGAEYKISATTTFSQDAPISPVAFTINKGDIIRFEAYNGSGDVGWGKRVYWRPQVEYLEITPSLLTAGAPEFTSTDGTALTSFSDIVSAGTVNVTLPVTLVNHEDTAGIMCTAVYNADNELVSAAISEKMTMTDGVNNFTASGMTVPAISGGFVKVFLVDSMDTLVPLSEIGNTPVYASASE